MLIYPWLAQDDFVNNRLQLGPDDNEYILNPENQSFLRQPSVSEQEVNRQLFFDQQKRQQQQQQKQQQQHHRARLTKKLLGAGAKRAASEDEPPSQNGPASSPPPAAAEKSNPLQLVALKKVKYHERKKSQEKLSLPNPVGKRANSVGENNGVEGSSEEGLPSVAKSRSLAGPRSSKKKNKGEPTTDNVSQIVTEASPEKRSELSTPPPPPPAAIQRNEHEGTRRKIRISPKAPPSFDNVQIKREINDSERGSEDGALETASSSSSLTPPHAVSSGVSATASLSAAASPAHSIGSTASMNSLVASSFGSNYEAEISAETQAKFDAAKRLNLSADLFDHSSETYRTISSLLYEFASHWARQCSTATTHQKGVALDPKTASKEVNDFFAEKFEDWFEELDPEGGGRQIKSFLRTMAMKSFGSVRNKMRKKLEGD